ncbi:MAG: LysE family translocator [Candidatus Puniceispirillum sp.]
MVLDIPLLIGYMTAVTLLTITPGVDTALIIQSSLSKTASAAAYAAVGILAGCAAWGLVVAGGLGAVVASSGAVYAALKTIGAGYLVWLGITALRRTVPPTVTPDSPRRESIAWVKKGFIANILNPKVGLFYLSLLPQFIPAGASVGRYALLLVAIHILLSAVWFWVVRMLVRRARKNLANNRLLLWGEKITGLLFIGFGIKLLISAR